MPGRTYKVKVGDWGSSRMLICEKGLVNLEVALPEDEPNAISYLENILYMSVSRLDN